MDEQLSELQEALNERYEIQRLLGEGGMALVYLARDVKHDREVAIKVLRPELAASIGAERFLQEIRITAKLSHPHVLPLYDSGEAAGHLYYVMPFVRGESLRDLIDREKQLPIDDAIRIAREVAEALAHAQDHGLIHRDIKPENILLSGGHALVADFGISRAVSAAGGERMTQTGMAIGTPAYMSPEQAAGDPDVDGRTDIYSLGCMLYEMLVGQVPFPAPTLQAMIARHTLEQVPPPSVMRPSTPAPLERVIISAMAKNPVDRFKNPLAFVTALDHVHTGAVPGHEVSTSQAAATSTAQVETRSGRRTLVSAASVVALISGGALVWWLATGRGANSSTAVDGAAAVTSLAVLPFENISSEPENEYFADGLTDELVDVFSGIEGIRVAGRRSTRAFKNTNDDATTIGRALNVDAILDGRVDKSGERVRISAELVDVTDGLQLWQGQYDRTVSDIFAVQEDIARSLVAELRGEIEGDSLAPAVEAPTQDAMAHDKYLWGRFNLNRETEEGARDAIDNFSMSIGFDSTFAQAYTGLADARLALIEYSESASTPAALDSVRLAAETALRLDPGDASAHAALGLVEYHTFDWAGAEAVYKQALEIEPDDPVVRQRYAELLATLGRLDEAIVQAQVAVDRDPQATPVLHTLLKAQRADGQNAAAIATGQRILGLNADDAQAWLDVGVLFLVEGRAADATDALESYAELSGGSPADAGALVQNAMSFAQRGVVASVPTGFANLVDAQPVQRAVFQMLVGDRDAALSGLENAHQQRHPDLTNLTTRPELGPLFPAPRLRAILVDLGLASQ